MSEENAPLPDKGLANPFERVGGRPITDKGIIRRAKQLIPRPGGAQATHDRFALILEWSKTDRTEFRNVSQWLKAKHPEIHHGTLQGWGGRTLWNKFREDFQAEAFARALYKLPDVPAKNFGRIIKSQESLALAVEKVIARLHKELDQEDLKTGDQLKDMKFLRDKTAFYASLIQTLKEVQVGMAEIERIMLGGLPPTSATQINVYSQVMEEMNERNQRLNVQSEPA